jgi:hypothetical protein
MRMFRSAGVILQADYREFSAQLFKVFLKFVQLFHDGVID